MSGGQLPSVELLQSIILQELEQHGSIKDTRELPASLPVDAVQNDSRQSIGASTEAQGAVKGALDSLSIKEARFDHSSMFSPVADRRETKQMVKYDSVTLDSFVLTAEGAHIVQNGSHEYIVWSACPSADAEGISAKDIEAKVGKENAKVGQGKAMKNKWIAKKGAGFVRAVEQVNDETRQDLVNVEKGAQLDDKLLAELKKRKLVDKRSVCYSQTLLP